MFNAQRVIMALFIVGLTTTAHRRCAFACSCAMPPSPTAALAASTAVFAGTVTSIDVYASPHGTVGSADSVTITVELSRTWKGPTHAWVQLTTVRDEASCGYTFERGQEYLIYARGAETNLTVDLCSRTKLLTEAGDDVAALGEGRVPAETTPTYPTAAPPTRAAMQRQDEAPEAQPAPMLVIAVLGFAALALFVRAVWLLTRRPPPAT